MAEHVVAWFDRIPGAAAPEPRPRPPARFADVLYRFSRVFSRNLPRYTLAFEPMRHDPGLKYEQYFALFTLAIFLYEEMDGVCYDEDQVLEKALLLAFIDTVVDDPGMGLDVAFRVGFFVFRGVPCDLPLEIERDVEHVRRVVDASRDKEALFRYMIELGEIEKRLWGCPRSDYPALRLVSNCQMLLGMFEWSDPEAAYALSCAGVVSDDVLDLATDETTYLTPENLDAYVGKAAACLHEIDSRLAYDTRPYIPLYAAGLRVLARAALEAPDDARIAFVGARRLAASLAVLWAVRILSSTA